MLNEGLGPPLLSRVNSSPYRAGFLGGKILVPRVHGLTMSVIPIIKHLRSSTDMPCTTLSGASLGPTEALVWLTITQGGVGVEWVGLEETVR